MAELPQGGGAAPRATPSMADATYAELRRIAARAMARERGSHTLSPTALVHEAYLRLAAQRAPSPSRAGFQALAARMMRRVLTDHARRRGARKRDAGPALEPPDGPAPGAAPLDALALDDALRRFEEIDARAAELVELRCFGGLSLEDASAALGISPATAKRDWDAARAWLGRALAP